MIQLKKIEKKDNLITCDALVEDCTVVVHLILDTDTGKFANYILPNGYEWCKSHIAHARKRLLDMVENNNIVSEDLIMWY